MTHTFARLVVTPAVYDEVASKLRAAGYDHSFVDRYIDCKGIALDREQPERRFWPIVPAPWVRESNKDKWSPRVRVLRYRAFRDEVGWKKVWAPTPGDLVVFMMPIPKSWTKRKIAEFDGMPHEQVPDTDNLMKALLDACYSDDAKIWAINAHKVWSSTPGIYIERRPPALRVPFTLEGV